MCPTRKVDARLPGKGHSNSRGAKPIHPIITMIECIRTSRLSMTNSLSAFCPLSPHKSQHTKRLVLPGDFEGEVNIGWLASDQARASYRPFCAPVFRIPAPSDRHPIPHTLHPTLFTLHPAPHTLHPAPHTLNPTPHTLPLTPYPLYHTPYTLHPTEWGWCTSHYRDTNYISFHMKSGCHPDEFL